MREYKFKFWSKTENKFISPYLIEFRPDGGLKSVSVQSKSEDIVPLLSTGFIDMEGKEVWEGDIVNYTAREMSMYGNDVAQILWDESAWFVKSNKWKWSLDKEFVARSLNIIGNIFQNAELLK